MRHDLEDEFDAGYREGALEQKTKQQAEPKNNPPPAAKSEPPLSRGKVLDWSALVGQTPPPREFVLQDWIPRRCVTLLHGFGGVGKTLLAQQIGTAAAFQREMLGAPADACPVLGIFGEDDHDELWRRQVDINAALGVSLPALANKLDWRACPDIDVTMFTGTNESSFDVTNNFDWLKATIRASRPRLTILDSATQIAAVPEINRPLVTRCLQALNSLCMEFETSILLIGHNNRAGDFSGSSAWENRARSRIHMKREKDAESGEETIKLCRPKANYAATEDGVAVEWHHGAYRCIDDRFETYGDRLDRETHERQVDAVFLAALDQLTGQRRTTSASPSARNYAPKLMTREGLVNGCAERDLARAMTRLFKDGQIAADMPLWQRPNRHVATGIGRKI